MEDALEALGLLSLHDETSDSLKRAFKASILQAHPDKGGKEGDFDTILSAYILLSRTLKRTTGGRDGLTVLDVDQVRQTREDQFTYELNNLVNEVMDSIDGSNEAFRVEFNAQFEKHHVREDRGYGSWLKEEEEVKEEVLPQDSWNAAFETAVRRGKPAPTTLMLHPEQMARSIGPRGMQLIPTDASFTSEAEDNPNYTDVHAAYTCENTLLDKLPPYEDTTKTFEELLKERDMVYVSELDRDLAAIQAYEKQKEEEEKAHKAQIADYFRATASSQWALRGQDSFIKEFK